MENILELCYQKSIELLKDNSTKFGILASGKSSKTKARNYQSIFGRDASICSLGMTVSGDKKLIASAKNSLETLAKYQADNGQIAFWVKPEKKHADFWYTGCIDSTLWWLIAIKFFDQNTKYNLSKKLKKQINKAINFLHCQEHPKFYLLSQNEANDWADYMPRSGFVLYSNALWYWVKKLYNLKDSDQTKKYFDYIFNPSAKVPAKVDKRLYKLLIDIKVKRKNPLYLSFVNRSSWGEEGDVFGNILACLVGLAEDKKIKDIIKYLKNKKASYPYPIKATIYPINKKDSLWRPYMNHLDLNKPYQYHNGGIWGFIGGFWVMLLSVVSDKDILGELSKLADLNKKSNWQFNEWFHGQSSRPMGVAYQSWNAAMFILAAQAFVDDN